MSFKIQHSSRLSFILSSAAPRHAPAAKHCSSIANTTVTSVCVTDSEWQKKASLWLTDRIHSTSDESHQMLKARRTACFISSLPCSHVVQNSVCDLSFWSGPESVGFKKTKKKKKTALALKSFWRFGLCSLPPVLVGPWIHTMVSNSNDMVNNYVRKASREQD